MPKTRRCKLLDFPRSTSYYKPKPESAVDQTLMKQIDRIHTDRPFLGSRRIVDALEGYGHQVNRKRVRRLMQKMGVFAIYPGPKTSKPHPKHKIYPYLLRNLRIDRANQVSASDITYLPMESEAFTGVLKDHHIDISMDGKGAWRDNVFVERLWRSVKYEEVYLNAYESMIEAKQSLKKYFQFYNQERKHQTLKATPDRVYYQSIKLPQVA